MPVIETGVGNCHVYVDAAADLDMALGIVLNAKTQRTSGLQRGRDAAGARGRSPTSSCRGSSRRSRRPASRCTATTRSRRTTAWCAATDEDYATEYLSLDISARGRRRPRRGDRAHPPLLAPATPRRS